MKTLKTLRALPALSTVAALLCLAPLAATPATLYVWQDSPNPSPPYATWEAAAHTIQDAVDSAASGDTVLVTNGVYASGGRAVPTTLLVNRVVIDKPITVLSVDGPAFTVIEGAKAPGGTNGDGAIRCVYLADGATLSGFTLTNGATRVHPAVWEQERTAGGVWCASTNAVVTNCTLTSNSADSGGGAYRGALYNCTLTGNLASNDSGGGAYGCTLYNCTLTGNSAYNGGGAWNSTLYNCTLTGNSASSGGGAYGGTLYNCIVYFNRAPQGANYFAERASPIRFEYSCTTPWAPGPGNIDADPLLDSDAHLLLASPCRGAGSATYASGVDIDGERWATPPSMGADEPVPGKVTGPLRMDFTAGYTNFAAGSPVGFTAHITGRLTQSVWDFGDGTVLTNQASASHAWNTPGTYTVQLTGYNDSHPEGVSTIIVVEVISAVHYVNAANPTPVPPYATWATAATAIQDAVDEAVVPGALVLVTNGTYAAGGRPAGTNVLVNRVAVDKPLTLRSVNGPGFTVIQGYHVPDTTNGDGAIRCVYLTNGASLSGFTLTNGATRFVSDWPTYKESGGGGVWCEPFGIVSNCTLTGNSAYEGGGGAYGGTLYNCTLTGNSASSGGGAYSSMLYNCTLTANSASGGGGASASTLHNCTLTGNSAMYEGGGASSSTLYNCTLAVNSAGDGGGAGSCILLNCTLTGNSATGVGGGVSYGTLYNCTLTGNSAAYGGAAYGYFSWWWPVDHPCILYNCTLTGNSATNGGGGVYGGGFGGSATLYNCIVYDNTAPWDPNWTGSSSFAYSCTTPLPEWGEGNMDADPQLDLSLHLSVTSPCIGAGSSAYSRGVDMDGEPWQDPPSMGADEYVGYGTTGTLTVAIKPQYALTEVAAAIRYTSRILDAVTAHVWNFGDGTVVSNQWSPSHAWSAPGTYEVRLTAYNDSHPQGVTATGLVQVVEVVHYVNGANATPLHPYTNWQTAATAIQEAVDAAAAGGWVLVTNGVYGPAAQVVEESCVGLNKPITVRSVNGPAVTVIQGTNALRCAYVGEGAVLSGFTLTGGYAYYGGGVLNDWGVVTNCVLTGNRAEYGGGGAYGGTLCNCILTGNSTPFDAGGALASALHSCLLRSNVASQLGGGVSDGLLYNCTLVGNSAVSGGGAIWSTLYNSVVWDNTAVDSSNHWDCRMAFSCTTPLPSGEGNIDQDPAFVNPAAGDFRLRHGSPCIDAGCQSSPSLTTDLAGLPRPLDGKGDGVATFDMGAYEYDLRGTISLSWFVRHGLDPDTPGVFAADPDRDGQTIFQEWVADTDPTNAASCLRVSAITPGPPVGVAFQSSATRLYTLCACTNLTGAVWTPVPGQTDIPGTGGDLILTDATPPPQAFYRVSVRVP